MGCQANIKLWNSSLVTGSESLCPTLVCEVPRLVRQQLLPATAATANTLVIRSSSTNTVSALGYVGPTKPFSHKTFKRFQVYVQFQIAKHILGRTHLIKPGLTLNDPAGIETNLPGIFRHIPVIFLSAKSLLRYLTFLATSQ